VWLAHPLPCAHAASGAGHLWYAAATRGLTAYTIIRYRRRPGDSAAEPPQVYGSMQIELLDRQPWRTRSELANAIFEWIEAFYNPVRRHSSLGNHSPLQFEQQHLNAAETAA